MTKLILTAIIVVVGAILWFWRRYGSLDEEVRKLKKQKREIRRRMRCALHDRRYDDYHAHTLEWLSILRQINDIRG